MTNPSEPEQVTISEINCFEVYSTINGQKIYQVFDENWNKLYERALEEKE